MVFGIKTFQFSLRSLVIVFLLISIVTGASVSWWHGSQLAAKRTTKHELEIGLARASMDLRGILKFSFWMPKEQTFSTSDELSFVINEVVDKTGDSIRQDLVNIRLYLLNKDECEIRIIGGSKSKEFVELFMWHFKNSHIRLKISKENGGK